MHKKATSNVQNSLRATLTRLPYLPQILLFAFSFLLYANTLGHDYTQDDAIVIYDNMYTTQGIDGIPGIFSNDTFYGFFKKEGKAKLVAGGRYRPFTQFMFAIEWELFGENPFIGHLVNVLLYGLLVILLFNSLILLFKQHVERKNILILAFLASLLFAFHPVHTEVVANIKGRDELMSLMLSLASLWLILKWLDTKKLFKLLLVVPVFLAGLLSKENAITFLAIIPIAILLFRDFRVKQLVGPVGILLLTTSIFIVIRVSVLGWDFGSKSMELMNNPFLKFENGQYIDFTLGEKMATIMYTLGKYIQLLVFPHPLTHDYYPRHIGIMTWTDWEVWLSLAVYIVLGILALLGLKKYPRISFGILFYLLTLSIFSNIAFPIGTNMSERFLFMPSVGFVIVLAVLVQHLSNYNKWLGTFFVILLAVLFSVKTISRNQVWKDDYTLFTTDVKTSANSAKVLNAAGGALVTKASKTTDEFLQRKMLNEATGYLNKAIEIHPSYKNAYLILGNAQFYLRDYVGSISSFETVLKFAPSFEDAKENLGIAHREAGKDFGMNKNDLQKALYHLEIALKMRPDEYETVRLYGIANALSGNNQEALIAFTNAIELEPDNAGAFLNLGNVYHHLGNDEQAVYYRQKALELDPEILSKQNPSN